MSGSGNNGEQSPVVVLVAPQMAENVGAVARAMLNCGLLELRLVRPRHGWPNLAAVPSASGADEVLDAARVYSTTAEAISDLSCVYATTARLRDMIKPLLSPREAAVEIHAATARGARVGLLFGPERTGLDNDDVVLSAGLIHVPLNPEFSSLNLAQAVLLVAYEWRVAGGAVVAPHRPPRTLERPATQGQLQSLFSHLEEELEEHSFFEVAEKRPSIVRRIRAFFARARPTDQEVRTLHGVITALARRPRREASAQGDDSEAGEP